MAAPNFDAFSYSVRPDLQTALATAWSRISACGSWWTGEQRAAVAREVHKARKLRGDPPWLRKDEFGATDELPAVAVEVARRVAIDAHRLDRDWCERMVAELGDAAYVELVSVAVFATMVESFCEALGVEPPSAEPAEPGEPDRKRPDGMGDAGAWVPMSVPFAGPNVGRALSLAPMEHMIFMGMVGSMYSMSDFAKLVWDRPLSRPQVELVAARVSAVNECFY